MYVYVYIYIYIHILIVCLISFVIVVIIIVIVIIIISSSSMFMFILIILLRAFPCAPTLTRHGYDCPARRDSSSVFRLRAPSLDFVFRLGRRRSRLTLNCFGW